jgi:hypothetical protein
MSKPLLPYGRQAQPLVLARQTQILGPVPIAAESTGLDIRTSFNNFIEPYGQMIVLQRLNLDLHCSQCWDEKLGEGDPQCPHCLGQGYQSSIERHISRKVSSLSEHRTQLLTQSSPGDEIVDELFWFFEWNVNPQAEDMLYEVSWTDPSKLLVDHLITAYKLTYAFPFRASGGRIEFWRTSAKSKTIDRTLIGEHLRRIASRSMTIPVDGQIKSGLNNH